MNRSVFVPNFQVLRAALKYNIEHMQCSKEVSCEREYKLIQPFSDRVQG